MKRLSLSLSVVILALSSAVSASDFEEAGLTHHINKKRE